MRILILLAVCAIALEAAVFKMETKTSGSQIRKLIKAGLWRKYWKVHYASRISKSEPLMDYFDNFYLANISVGTPPQLFTIVPDTGSSNLWLIDNSCNTPQCVGIERLKNRFNHRNSSTYVNDGRQFSMQYGSGSCSGFLAVDKISFVGLSYNQQVFGLATTIADVFGRQPVDGIMGLGWPQLAILSVVPPMQNILPQLEKPIFTFWMGKTKSSDSGVAGSIVYGGLDPDHCESQIHYVDLSSTTYWQFPMHGFKIGKYRSMRTEQVISDTGTSWIGAPGNFVSKIIRQVGGYYDAENGLALIDCSAQNKIPDLILNIAKKNLHVPANEYTLDVGLEDGKCALTFFPMNGAGYGPSWILGDSLIRSYCNIYDIGNKRVGFALAKSSH